jgi:hypothetical protein
MDTDYEIVSSYCGFDVKHHGERVRRGFETREKAERWIEDQGDYSDDDTEADMIEAALSD